MELQENPTSESTTTLHRQTNSVENVSQEKSIKEKIKSTFNLLTVEPVLFLYLFSTSLALGAIFNMPFEMGCRANLKLNETLCSNISIGIQHVSVLMVKTYAWSVPVQTGITAILVLCFGSFSDRHKIRKPFMVLPIIGELFSCVGLMLCAVFISEWPIEVFQVMAIIMPSFFGGGQTVIMAVMSYITDISTKEERTSRIGFVEIVSLILTPLGPAISGLLFLKIGYYGVYSVCFVLYLTAVLYGIFFIKEAKSETKRDENMCCDVFNIKSVVVDMYKIIMRKRPAFKRMLLILSYCCYILIKGPISAETVYIRNYAIQTFQWSIDIFGYYSAFDIIVHIFGMLLAITIFTKKLKLNDIVIAVIACIFKIIVGIWYAFGTNLTMFLIAPCVSVFSGLYVIALRSLVTKLVATNEIAKAQALFAICEAICPLIYSTAYYKFYSATRVAFPGAFFLLTVSLVTLPLIVLFMMNVVSKDIDISEPETNGRQENGRQENGRHENGNEIEISRF